MAPRIDLETVARLLKLRVLLAGRGAFRMQPNPESGAFGAFSVLHGSAVRLWSGMAGVPHAQMFYPSGRPLSGELNLRSPVTFASLIHNVDAQTWDGPGAADDLPPDLASVADLAIASSDPDVRRAVDAAWDDGRTVDLGSDEGWRMDSRAWDVVQAALHAPTPALSGAAAELVAVLHGERAPQSYDVADSLVRANEYVEALLSVAEDRGAQALSVGEQSWVRLWSPAGVCASARRLGRLEGEFLNASPSSLLRPRTDKEKRAVATAAQAWLRGEDARLGMHARALRPDVEFWSLRDGDGHQLALACVERGEVLVFGQDGRDAEALASHIDAVGTLRFARVGGEPDPAGPSFR
jgi:hypothetical protein